MEQLKNLTLPFTLDTNIPNLYGRCEYKRANGDVDVLLDLTEDTVKPSDVKKGVVFHMANGQKAVGTLEV